MLGFRNILILSAMAWLASACSRHLDDFSEFAELPSAGWAYADTLTFTADVDSVTTGSLQLAVRHTNDYPYRNLYVEVTVADSSGIALRDTVDLRLCDLYGNWLGSGLGTSFQASVTVAENLTVTQGATIIVRHVMRPDPVPHIEQVGVLFTADER